MSEVKELNSRQHIKLIIKQLEEIKLLNSQTNANEELREKINKAITLTSQLEDGLKSKNKKPILKNIGNIEKILEYTENGRNAKALWSLEKEDLELYKQYHVHNKLKEIIMPGNINVNTNYARRLKLSPPWCYSYGKCNGTHPKSTTYTLYL